MTRRPGAKLCAALALIMTAGAAGAQSGVPNGFDPEQYGYCEKRQTGAPDVTIGGCTALIRSGKASGALLAAILMQRGDAYRSKGEHSLALRDYEQAIKTEGAPANLRAAAHFGRAAVSLLSKSYAIAVVQLNEAIKLNPDYAAAYAARGGIHLVEKRYDEALKDFASSLSREQPSAELTANTHHLRALTYNGMRQEDRALEAIGISLATAPDAAGERHQFRGQLRAARGDHAGARADYDAALKLVKNDPAVTAGLHVLKGLAFANESREVEAEAEYKRAIAAKPDHAPAHRGAAQMKAAWDDHKGAVAGYSKALELEPDYAPALAARSFSYGELGEHERALKDIDRAVALAPDNAGYRNSACWVRAADLKRDMERALKECDEAVRLAPKDGEYLDSRGLVWLQMGRFEEAWRDYDAAMKIDPKHGHALYGRGIAALKLGRTAEGEADMKRAANLRKDAAALYAGYGVGPCATKSAAMNAAGTMLSDTPLGRLPAACGTGEGAR